MNHSTGKPNKNQNHVDTKYQSTLVFVNFPKIKINLIYEKEIPRLEKN